MLLVAFGYRELNNRMPDAGTSFTWAARAFGPWVGWMAGWGLVVATILVLSNLAGVAVDFLFLLISQITGNAEIADLASNTSSTSACACCSCSRRPSSRTATCRPPRSCSTCSWLPGARAGVLRRRRDRRGGLRWGFDSSRSTSAGSTRSR
jgi:amino acid transporter